MNKLTICATVALCAFGMLPIAQAGKAYEGRTEVVPYSQFEASNAVGAAVLFKRMSNAAHRVCRDFQPRSISLRKKYQTCVQQALGDAVVGIDSPAVTAYAAARGVFVEAGTTKIARAD
jgi:UrcA family protein